MKIGFIGVGNMGYPILLALKETFGKENIIFTDNSETTRRRVQEETGIASAEDNASSVLGCDYVVIAVKPQFFGNVLSDIKGKLGKNTIIISIAAGITIDTIKASLGQEVRVIRSMPNTAAMVLEAMTGVCYSKDTFTNEEKDFVDKFFKSFGKYEIFDESLMNAVVCANGSSPAYVYLFMEALADSVVKYGIPRDKAYTLVSQTVLGAAKFMLESKEHPAKLKDNVCSPGGTTIAGVSALEEFGFRNSIIKATDACYKRAVELSEKK